MNELIILLHNLFPSSFPQLFPQATPPHSELPSRLSHLLDWYLSHACCFTSHIDIYRHCVLSTDSIVYVCVVFFMLQLRFASYLINEYVMLCYVMSIAPRFEQIDRAARDRSFSAACPLDYTAAGTYLRLLQTSSENSFIWCVRFSFFSHTKRRAWLGET